MPDETQPPQQDIQDAQAVEAEGQLSDDALAQIDGAGMSLGDMGIAPMNPVWEGSVPVLTGDKLRQMLGGG